MQLAGDLRRRVGRRPGRCLHGPLAGAESGDPPLVLAPNKRLELLEQRVANSYGDIKLRVSGEIMEYKGRNYLLLSRWAVLPDPVRPLQ